MGNVAAAIARPSPAGPAPKTRLIQRACACGTKAGGECEECKKKPLQRKGDWSGPAMPQSIAGADFAGGGGSVPPAIRRSLEPLFGVSFSGVRLHDEPRSHTLAHDLNARAFTVGQDVHFATGQFRPDSRDGLRLLAHELTHTVQQRGTADAPAAQGFGIAPAQSPSERRADQAAEAVLAGRAVGAIVGTGPLLSRQGGGGTGSGSGGGSGAPAPPTATGATFSETATAKFKGYDASVTPNWLIVPSGASRTADAAVTPAGASATFVSVDTSVATVASSGSSITVTGVAKGTTRVEARAGTTELTRLRIAVKDRKDVSTGFNYVSDSATPTPHSTAGTATDTPGLVGGINNVWEEQANVRFTNAGSHTVKAAGDLGAAVDWTSPGGGEWNTVTALGAGDTHNVFRVWAYLQDGASANGGANMGANTMLADASCADGLGLAHESGHHLTLDHPSGGIMTPCGSRTDRRVTKAMVDTINP